MASRSYVVNYSGGTLGYIQLKLNIYTVSTDINNNTTTERADLWMQVNNSSGQWYNNYDHNSYVGIGGHDYTKTNTRFDARTTGDKLLIGTWDTVVSHNTDGTKTIGISAWHNSGVGLGNASIVDTYTCDTIPRQATVTNANDFNDEQNPSFTFSNPAGFPIDAYLEFGSPTTTILRTNIPNTGSYTFTLTSGERNTLLGKCPNSNTMTVRYVLQTNVGGNPTWWSWLDKTMSVVNANPTFTTYTYQDINTTTIALTGNDQILVKGYSNLKVDITTANKATALKSATMIKYRLSDGTNILDEENYSVNNTVTLDKNGIIGNLIRVFAIDSRNNSTYKDYNATTKEYSDINIKSFSVNRSDGGIGKITSLDYGGDIWNNSFGSVSNSIISATYKYKKTTDSSYTNGTTNIMPTLNGNTYTFSGNIKGDLGANGFDNAHNYNIQIVITDKLSSYTADIVLQAGKPQFAFGEPPFGVAFGGLYKESVGGTVQVDGINIMEKNIATMTNTGRPTITIGQVYGSAIIPFNSGISTGSKLTTDTSNNKIIVGAGVSKVKVSGRANVFTAPSVVAELDIKINQNTANIITGFQTRLSNQNFNDYGLGEKLVSVAENDYFTMLLTASTTGDYVILSDSVGTFLTVEVVE